MKRWSAFVAVVGAAGVAFLAGGSVSWSVAKPAAVAVGHRTAVFNMAAVMRDFHLAKYKVWSLNNKKTEMSKQLVEWRDEYIQHQKDLQRNPNHPQKEQKARQMLDLARKIEDADRDINKQLNDDASGIIADLYDMIKAEVDKTAEENGFQLVLAYPDAITREERQSPYIKELKLKPPAAQPFYVASDIDITARVVEALNEKHPPIDPETKKPVDVSKLEAPSPPAPALTPSGPIKIQLPPGAFPMGGPRPAP